MTRSLKIKIIVILFSVLMLFLIYFKVSKQKNTDNLIEKRLISMFENIDNNATAKINKYIIYGTHLNLEGTIEIPKISKISIDSAHIILNDSETEISLDTNYTYHDNILSFSTLSELNKGINLEKLNTKNYYILLKVILSNSEIKYYSLSNNTKYGDTTYYSLTKNNTNNKIDVKFDIFNNIPCMLLSCSSVDSLPYDVHDIAIDASHGGKETGAVKGKYTEAEIVLDCANILKQKLEEIGLKVFLTRNGSEPNDSNMATNMYDENGRINIAQESKSKILISLNINDIKSKSGGVEVYAPTNCDLEFAKTLASNIVKTANTSYSTSNLYKKDEGVYVRSFSDSDILVYKARAIAGKYEPYNLTTYTPYLYMIREIGGIATNAFVDGRNKNYGKNKYYDSNIGIEGYSIELGYMTVNRDLDNILKNKTLYMEGIANTIIDYFCSSSSP